MLEGAIEGDETRRDHVTGILILPPVGLPFHPSSSLYNLFPLLLIRAFSFSFWSQEEQSSSSEDVIPQRIPSPHYNLWALLPLLNHTSSLVVQHSFLSSGTYEQHADSTMQYDRTICPKDFNPYMKILPAAMF